MTDFPTAMDSTLPKGASDYSKENVIGWYKDSEIATVTFSQGRYISKIKKLAEKYPDDVKVLENADGTILAYIPVMELKQKNTRISTCGSLQDIQKVRVRNE